LESLIVTFGMFWLTV